MRGPRVQSSPRSLPIKNRRSQTSVTTRKVLRGEFLSTSRCEWLVQFGMADYAVRAAVIDDLRALTDIYNHYVVHTAITFDLQTFAPAERQAWFDAHRNSGPYRLIVATDDQQQRCLGYASSSRWRPKPAYDTTVE